MCSYDNEYRPSSSIALFLPTLTPGGIERCMLNLASGFIQHEIDVDLVIADYRGDFISKIPEEVNVVDLDVTRVLKSISPLREYLTNTEPDVLLSGHTHANIASVIAGKISRVETTVAIGIHNTHSLSKSSSQGFTSNIIRLLYPRLYSHADHVIAVSKGAKQDIVRNTSLRANDVSVIHNPVVTIGLHEEASKLADNRWLNDESIDVVLSVGRLAEQKDFETLLRAFEKVSEQNARARLLIVGTGSKESQLRAVVSELGIEKQVKLVGYVDNLYAYMNAADVFVLSSKWEGFGIVLVEAMAVGTPVVSTDCPHGPNEILNSGEYGELVEVGDVEALSDSIHTVLSGKNKCKQIKERAKDFSVSNITRKYYNELHL